MSALRQSSIHSRRFPDRVVLIASKGDESNRTSDSPRDLENLRKDAVGDASVDYGELDAKIESIAQLRQLKGARAELAFLSLSRAYVRNCVDHRGPWTSGLHILWWTMRRLALEPDVRVSDLLGSSFLPLARQVELAQWSLVMLRLTLVSDLGHHAQSSRDPISAFSDLVEEAAVAVDTPNLRRLLRWIAGHAAPRLSEALPEKRYAELSRHLHRPRPVARRG